MVEVFLTQKMAHDSFIRRYTGQAVYLPGFLASRHADTPYTSVTVKTQHKTGQGLRPIVHVLDLEVI